MGGKHVTSDDTFKALELNRWKVEVAEREKD
jgi:hypothetical protein